MLDKLRNAVSPAATSAEIVAIETELAVLDLEREEHRIAAGHLVQQMGQGQDGARESTILKHRDRITAIDEKRAELRDRRRSLLQLLKPEPKAKAALVEVTMSDDLVNCINELAAARARRQSYIAERFTDQSEAHEKKRQKAIDALEDEIRGLRVRRAELLVPYNAELEAALSPYVRSAAQRLLDGSQVVLAALAELGEIAGLMPAPPPGGSSMLGFIGEISTANLFHAQSLANACLHANPEIPAE